MSAPVMPSGSGSDRDSATRSALPGARSPSPPALLLPPFGLDVQHPVRDGQFDILVGIDAGQVGSDHQRPVFPVFLDVDQVPGFQPVRERHRPERHHPRPLIEHPVEPAEHAGCLPGRLALAQTWHGRHLQPPGNAAAQPAGRAFGPAALVVMAEIAADSPGYSGRPEAPRPGFRARASPGTCRGCRRRTRGRTSRPASRAR